MDKRGGLECVCVVRARVCVCVCVGWGGGGWGWGGGWGGGGGGGGGGVGVGGGGGGGVEGDGEGDNFGIRTHIYIILCCAKEDNRLWSSLLRIMELHSFELWSCLNVADLWIFII